MDGWGEIIRGGVVGKECPGGRRFQDIEGGIPLGRGVIWCIWCIRWDALIRGRRSL